PSASGWEPALRRRSSADLLGREALLVAGEPLLIGPDLPVLGGIHVGEHALLRGRTDAVAVVADLRAESLFLFLELLEERLGGSFGAQVRSEEHTSELQSRFDLVCRLLLEKKKYRKTTN